MNKVILYIIVFLSGASILAIEVLGTRILGPFYGVTLYLWTALITVTLAALSLGYFIGGYFADKNARMSHISWLLTGSAVWVFAIPLLKIPLLRTSDIFGIRAAVLVAAIGLFFVPLTLMGMISPFAIRVRAGHLDEVGRCAGKLYAISTMGSVFSALSVGFFLIPVVGVARLTILTGILLLIAAGLGVIGRNKSTIQRVVIIVSGAIGSILLFTNGDLAQPEYGLLEVRQSNYGELRVLDTVESGGEYRYLIIDGCVHSVVDRAILESVCSYVEVLDVPKYIFNQPGKLLLIGLGAGSVAQNYSRVGWETTIVEIDPEITELAQLYFDFRQTDGKVIHGDGRQFVRQNRELYDLIVVDAFGSSSIPFHMITVEAFEEMQSSLTEDGILAINIIALDRGSNLISSVCKTLHHSFKHISVLPLPPGESHDTLSSFIVLASGNRIGRGEDDEVHFNSNKDTYSMEIAWQNRYVPDYSMGTVITDDLNPVDIWSEAINLEDRKFLRVEFGFKGLNW